MSSVVNSFLNYFVNMVKEVTCPVKLRKNVNEINNITNVYRYHSYFPQNTVTSQCHVDYHLAPHCDLWNPNNLPIC